MAADDDDKTRFGAVPPPPKIPAATPLTKPASEDDRTQIASPPPPPAMPGRTPAKPPAAAASDEHTQFAAAPPPPGALRPPSAPAAAPPVASRAPVASAEMTKPPATSSEDATVMISDRSHGMIRLQRVQPPGRTDAITLERAGYTLGRSPACDIELFSATASREHARIIRRERLWFIEPIERRDLMIDGKLVRHETQLVNRMRLQLGDDELLFLDGSAAPQAAATAAPASQTWLVLAIVGVVVLALGAWLLFARGG